MDSEEEDDYLFGGNRDVVKRRPRTFKARINFFWKTPRFAKDSGFLERSRGNFETNRTPNLFDYSTVSLESTNQQSAAPFVK